MPWCQTSSMDQRTQFIADYLRELLSVTGRCDLYGISRTRLASGSNAIFDRGRRDSKSERLTN